MVEKLNIEFVTDCFALLLSNESYQDNFFSEVSNKANQIESNFNARQKIGEFKVRYVKKVSLIDGIIKINTSMFVSTEEIADSIHEVFPCHGIAVVPWSEYSA